VYNPEELCLNQNRRFGKSVEREIILRPMGLNAFCSKIAGLIDYFLRSKKVPLLLNIIISRNFPSFWMI
jgi:hypothetical protein